VDRKILNLKLLHKGAHIDTIKEKRDFQRDIFVGSGQNTLWQIFNNILPEKYLLVSKRGGEFILNLRKGMSLLLKRNNNSISEEEIKAKKLIEGNTLFLKEDTAGKIELGDEWVIEYEYVPVFKKEITSQERMLIKQYGRRSEMSPEEKFSFAFFTLALLCTSLGLFTFSKYYNPVVFDHQRTLQAYDQKVATAVVPKVVYQEEQPETGVTETEEAITDQKEVVTPATKSTTSGNKVDYTKNFGFDPNTPVDRSILEESEYYQVQVVSAITAASDLSGGQSGTGKGSGNKGSGKGSGTGKGTGKGSGSGSGLESIEQTATPSKIDLGNLMEATEYKELTSSGKLDVSVSKTNLAGNSLGDINVKKVENKQQFITAVKSLGANLVKIEEKEIQTAETNLSSLPPGSEVKLISEKFKSYKTQLELYYNKAILSQEIYGSVLFEVLIEPGGKINSVDFTTAKGSKLPESFLLECVKIIKQWKIDVTKPTVYPLRMNFMDI